MKSIFTLLFIAAFSLLNAQTLVLNVDEINLAYNETIHYGDVSLTNTGNSTIELATRLERVCYIDGDETTIQICFGALCYFGVSETTTWGDIGDNPVFVMTPGYVLEGTECLKFTQENWIYGSEWNVVFFDRNDTDNKATLKVTIEECVNTPILSTNDFNYEIGSAFPNPASEMINISYKIDANNAQLNIYNALGMRVESIEVSPQNEAVAVNVAHYTNGVYFYQVTDGKDQSRMLSFVK